MSISSISNQSDRLFENKTALLQEIWIVASLILYSVKILL